MRNKAFPVICQVAVCTEFHQFGKKVEFPENELRIIVPDLIIDLIIDNFITVCSRRVHLGALSADSCCTDVFCLHVTDTSCSTCYCYCLCLCVLKNARVFVLFLTRVEYMVVLLCPYFRWSLVN